MCVGGLSMKVFVHDKTWLINVAFSARLSFLPSTTHRNLNEWTIQLGMTRRHSHTYYGQKVKVSRVIPHPQYSANHDNDIAMFQVRIKNTRSESVWESLKRGIYLLRLLDVSLTLSLFTLLLLSWRREWPSMNTCYRSVCRPIGRRLSREPSAP